MTDQETASWFQRIIISAQKPDSFITTLAQSARQYAAAQNGANAVDQTRNAAADVRFEQLVVAIERFAVVAAINGMIAFGWGQNENQEKNPQSLYPVAVRGFKRIGAEASRIRADLRSAMKLNKVDSTQQILMSKMQSVMDSQLEAAKVKDSFTTSMNKKVGIGTYLMVAENIVTIARLGRIRRRILDTKISNWSLAAAVQTALGELALGEADRLQREPLVMRLYFDAGSSLDVVRNQYRGAIGKLGY